MTDPGGGLSSVRNALAVLRLLQENREMGTTEVARQLGMAKSSAHRLLAALERDGFADRSGHRKAYRLGPALLELGLTTVARLDIRQTYRPAMEQISAATNETTLLVVRRHAQMFVVDRVDSPQIVRASPPIGSRKAAHTTGGGKALLAELPWEQVVALFEGELASETDASILSLDALHEDLDLVRARGYALNVEESRTTMCGVGIALHTPAEPASAAIAVVVPTSRWASFDPAATAEIVRDTVAGVPTGR